MRWTADGKPWSVDWPEDERTTAAVERVWSLLAMQHPQYQQVWRHGNWALTQKHKWPIVGRIKRVWQKALA